METLIASQFDYLTVCMTGGQTHGVLYNQKIPLSIDR